jgi:peptidoglycan hydrolase CwlO-like protein
MPKQTKADIRIKYLENEIDRLLAEIRKLDAKNTEQKQRIDFLERRRDQLENELKRLR